MIRIALIVAAVVTGVFSVPALAQVPPSEPAPVATEPAIEAPPTAPPAEAAPVSDPAAAMPAAEAAVEPAGTARIIFFRPKRFVGAAVGFMVREQEVEVGRLRNGTYFMLDVAPGKHEYTVQSEAKDLLTMEVEAGGTYYVQGAIGIGLVAGRPNLSPADQATFDAIKDKLRDDSDVMQKKAAREAKGK